MRTQEEIEKRLEGYSESFAFAYVHDPERSTRIYSAYRALYWILHQEIDNELELARSINIALGLAGSGAGDERK